MPTFDVHLTCDPFKLTVEADRAVPSGVIRQGAVSTLHAYELVDADGAPVLVVPLDALVAIRRREEST